MSKKKKEKKDKKDKKDKRGKRCGKRDRAAAAAPALRPGGARPEAGPGGEPCPGGKKCGKPGEHLCRIAKRGDVDTLRELVREATFLCAKCGRAAARAKSLCRPVPI